MLGLLYFGRLEKEKGFDGILEMIELFKKDKQKLPFELFVFGSGSGEKRIQDLAERYDEIHYFGRKNIEEIKRYVENCQYCLMPSECLETFGLSALNAIKRGLPVIGYAKGGLKEFIDPRLDLTHQLGHTTGEKLHHMITSLTDPKGHETFHHFNLSIFQQYSKESRLMNFYKFTGKKVKKILIVSDFINKIGGIETYINEAKALLEQHGYEVQLCGGKVPRGPIGKLAKYLGIFTGIGNFREAIKLRRKIQRTKPDLIRYNSVMRYLGRAPIRASRGSTAKKRMMVHDLGYFFPFPSQLSDEKQIKPPLTLSHFLASSPTRNLVKKLAMIGKYLSLSLIRKQLQKRVDTFLVPSEYMKDILHASYKIPADSIQTFPHFIQE